MSCVHRVGGFGVDLAGTWDSLGCRAIASDFIVSCVRQIRALRNFGAGVTRASGQTSGACGSSSTAARSRARSGC